MRTWGRVGGVWTEVDTDQNGFNDSVFITTLIQTLLLGLSESPFFANYGIPAQQSVLTQIFPDFYTYQTQQQYAQFFTLLTVRKVPSPTPTYDITVVTHSGALIQLQVPT